MKKSNFKEEDIVRILGQAAAGKVRPRSAGKIKSQATHFIRGAGNFPAWM
ncbi:MAG: hypothetical protein AB7K68_00150 [Bacteriovoracia bacterium]